MALPIKFKNVGKTIDRLQTEQDFITQERKKPFGIKTPLRFGDQDGIFAMNFVAADQIHDNFRNLLQTNHGERLELYDFGCNLSPLTTELVAREDFENEAMTRIKTAVAKYMPYLELQGFETLLDNTQNNNTGKVKIRITYAVPLLGIKDKKIQVTLFVI